MMRSLFSGVSGIKVHQTRMDVIGNNIANINTVGFKSSRTTFSDMFSQLQKAASAPTDRQGGINPRQIGLGVNVESIDLMFADASPQQTGKNTDLALAGNGLFVLRNGDQSYYTRNGAFMFDEQGYYVLPGSGLRVQGWNATSNGVIDTNALTTDIVVPVGKTMEATETTSISYSGNLNKESSIIEKITYTKSTDPTADDTKVVTTDDEGNTTSINIDGKNVMAAKITFRDGTTMNVTSGYYEVGKSVPITTLATIYDSLGGKHEVTVLIDKDPTSEDNVTDIVARSSGKDTSSYTDANGVTHPVTRTVSGNSYSYTDANGTTYPVTATATYTYTNADGEEQTVNEADVTTNADGTYSYTVGEGDAAVTYSVTRTATYNYTDAGGNTQTVDEANVTTTPTYTYTYTDANGDTQTVDEADLTTSTVYDNRWRVYIAPGIGEKGPADSNFANSYTRSAENGNPEADGSGTTGTMNMVSFLYFDDRGHFISNGKEEDASITFEYFDGNGAASNQAILSFDGLSQYASSTTSFPTSNGNAAGVLQSLSIDASGIITGAYTNGLSRTEAQIAVAQFQNAAGLTKSGTTIYQESNNSGQANIKTIDDFGMTVTASALEMSNVDLATEFSDMIITQRGFQANSKITTVSDEMLETLVNMKR